jgi:Heavy metal binding domain
MSAAPVYICPMHAEVRAANACKCPRCRMRLVPEGAKLGILQHMLDDPLYVAAMVVVMLAAMAAAMMFMK